MDDEGFEELINELGISIDKVLQTEKKENLLEIVNGIMSTCTIKELVDILTEEFTLKEIFNWLEKNKPTILTSVLHEPEVESQVKEPVRRFLESKWNMHVDFEVPLPVSGKSRSIDICGYEYHKKKPYLVSVELKKASKRGDIDKAFGQAADNAKGVNESYVAFSPLVFFKHLDTIEQKSDDYEQVGVLVVDSLNVLTVYTTPDIDVSDDLYDSVLEYMEGRFG